MLHVPEHPCCTFQKLFNNIKRNRFPTDKQKPEPLKMQFYTATSLHNAQLRLQQNMLWNSPAPFISNSRIKSELCLLGNMGITTRITAQSFPTTPKFQPKKAKMPAFRPLNSIVSAFRIDVEQRELNHKSQTISALISIAPGQKTVSCLVASYNKLTEKVGAMDAPAVKAIRKVRDTPVKTKEIEYSFRTVFISRPYP
jgi:hypothetical protein